MRKSRFTDEQIVAILREADKGSVAAAKLKDAAPGDATGRSAAQNRGSALRPVAPHEAVTEAAFAS